MDAMVAAVGLAGLILVFSLWGFLKRRFSNEPPGPIALPIIGNMYLIGSRSLHLMLNELAETYGDIFTMQLGSRKTVILGSRETIHNTFVKKAKAFAGRPDLPTFRYTRNGQTGLSLCDYSEEYVKNRRMTTKAIHHFLSNKQDLEAMLKVEAGKMIKLFDDLALMEKSFVPWFHFQKIVPSMFLNIMFGCSVEYDDPKFTEAVKVYRKWFDVAEADNPADFFSFLQYFPNKRLQVAKECGIYFETYVLSLISSCGKFTHSLFNDFKNEETNNNDKKLSIELQKAISKIISDIIGGGFETSAAVLSWAILYLNKRPDILFKCREEISLATSDRLVTPDKKSQMPYFSATIFDILRLSTVAPLGIARKVTQDTVFSKYHISKDTMVLANLWAANHDPQFWDNPNELDPNHFLTEDGKLDKDLTRDILTFSSGIRRCPGDEIGILMLFVLLGTLIKNYDVELTEPPEDMVPMRGMTLKPKHYTMTLKSIR